MNVTATRVISHNAGDRSIARGELAGIPAPAATRTWFPVPHATVANTTIQALEANGYHIRSERWTLSKSDQRIFGVIDLALPLADWSSPGRGTSVSIGIRSSFDKRLPLGLVAGSRVLVCSNLAFSGEISYRRKHTANGLTDFENQIQQAIERLPAFQQFEAARIESWMNYELTQTQADSLILALFESGVIGIRQFNSVMAEYRQPTYAQDFNGLTVWSVFNRLTTGLRQRAATRAIEHAGETSRLIHQLDSIVTAGRVRGEGIISPLALEYSGD